MEDRRRYRSFLEDSARWDHLQLRGDDIVISTAPKCGTTWMQMLCALLVFGRSDLPAPLGVLSPFLDMQLYPLDEVVDRLEAQKHRRFVKTHTPLDGLPFDPRVTYLYVGRDPRDVAMSSDNHRINMDLRRTVSLRIDAVGIDDLEEQGITGPPPPPPDDPEERFWMWMEGDPRVDSTSPLERMVHHATTFWERRDQPNIHLFHYGDLRVDLAGQMTRLAEILGVDAPTEELVDAAGFGAMKARADQLAPEAELAMWHDTSRFFDQARSGTWRALIADDGRYETTIGGLAPPDLVAWLHRGWLG
jgi:aryl sulfotransferase